MIKKLLGFVSVVCWIFLCIGCSEISHGDDYEDPDREEGALSYLAVPEQAFLTMKLQRELSLSQHHLSAWIMDTYILFNEGNEIIQVPISYQYALGSDQKDDAEFFWTWNGELLDTEDREVSKDQDIVSHKERLELEPGETGTLILSHQLTLRTESDDDEWIRTGRLDLVPLEESALLPEKAELLIRFREIGAEERILYLDGERLESAQIERGIDLKGNQAYCLRIEKNEK